MHLQDRRLHYQKCAIFGQPCIYFCGTSRQALFVWVTFMEKVVVFEYVQIYHFSFFFIFMNSDKGVRRYQLVVLLKACS